MHTPADEAELAEMLRAASGPLDIIGGGTRIAVGGGAALSTAALTGITEYDPGALTMTARAGTPLDEIEARLATEGQRLAFEPMDARALLGTGAAPRPGGTGAPTVGGMVAANASGPRRIQAGACRDALLGVRFIDGQGTIIRNGGRVMKNVTGYDLVRLLAGSMGTLGALSEVTLKLAPRPEAQTTLALRGLEDVRAVAALAAGLSSPWEVSGAAHWPGQGTFLRIEGFAQAVERRAGLLADWLAPFGTAEVIDDATESAALWCDIRDVAPFAGRGGDVWRVSVKPSDGPEAASRARVSPEDVLYDWGGGLVWMLFPEGTDLRARLGDLPGHATLMRAAPDTIARLGRQQPEPPAIAALSAGLRQQFDPRGIFAAPGASGRG